MDDHLEAIHDWMDKAQALPDGLAQTECVERAVAAADEAQDLDLQFGLRLSLAQSAFNSGQLEKTIVSVAWCFGAYDREPDRFDAGLLLDVCTFAMNSLSSLPQFSRPQVQKLLDDMQSRYERAGFGLRAVERARCFNALWMGDAEEADRRFQTMTRLPLDPLESEPWLLLFEADYLVQRGRDREAIELTRPMLKAGGDESGAYCWMACFMLTPLVRCGEAELAEAGYRQSVAEIRENPNYAECVAHCLLYLVSQEREEAAGELVERCLPWATDVPMLRESFELALAAWAYFRLCERRGAMRWSGTLPESAPGDRSNEYATSSTSAWLETFVRESAARFDARNGNSHFARMVDDRLAFAGVG